LILLKQQDAAESFICWLQVRLTGSHNDTCSFGYSCNRWLEVLLSLRATTFDVTQQLHECQQVLCCLACAVVASDVASCGCNHYQQGSCLAVCGFLDASHCYIASTSSLLHWLVGTDMTG
jgi:hypothetical protein